MMLFLLDEDEKLCKMHEDLCHMWTIAFLTQPLKTDDWFHVVTLVLFAIA